MGLPRQIGRETQSDAETLGQASRSSTSTTGSRVALGRQGAAKGGAVGEARAAGPSAAAVEEPAAGAAHPAEGGESATGVLRGFLRKLERRRDAFLHPDAVRPPVDIRDMGAEPAPPRSFGGLKIVNPHLQRVAEKLNETSSAKPAADSLKRLGTEALHVLDQVLVRLSHAHGGHDHGHAHGHDHEHGGGLGLDLDEAVHGVYAMINYLIQALKGGGGDIAKQFEESARLLQSGALPYLHEAGQPEGVADLAVTWVVGAVLAPLAFVAIKAGVEEVRGARHLGKALKAEMARLKEEGATLDALQASAGDREQALPLLDALRAGTRQRVGDVRFTADQNVADTVVGLSSIGAGAAILANASGAAITKTYAAVNMTATATTMAGNAGVAAAPGGSLASAASLALTAALTVKARRKRDQFHADAMETKERLDWLRGQGLSETHLHHLETMIAKIDQEDDFHSSFVKGCLGLLAGAGLYTTGQLARDALLIAAATGALAATKGAALPVVLGLLLAANAGGGLIMAAYANTLFRGHPKQARYQGYHIDDDVDLDREFVPLLDLLPKFSEKVGPLTGSELRSMITEQWDAQEDLRQDVLGKAADDLGLRFEGWYAYTGDKPEVVEKRIGQRTGRPPEAGSTKPRRRDMALEIARRAGEDAKGRAGAFGGFIAGFGSAAESGLSIARQAAKARAEVEGFEAGPHSMRRGRAFLGSLGRQAVEGPMGRARDALRPEEGEPRSPLRHLRAGRDFATEALRQPFSTPAAQARDSWNAGRPYLTGTHLAGWLADNAHVPEQIDLMLRVVEGQIRVLDAKLPAKIGAYALMTEQTIQVMEAGDGGTEGGAMPAEVPQKLGTMLKALDDGVEQDDTRREQLKTLHRELRSWQSSGFWRHADSEALSRCRERFVALQTGVVPSEAKASTPDESRKALADFLLKDAPKLYRDRRGKMKNLEMQVTRLMGKEGLLPGVAEGAAEAPRA